MCCRVSLFELYLYRYCFSLRHFILTNNPAGGQSTSPAIPKLLLNSKMHMDHLDSYTAAVI